MPWPHLPWVGESFGTALQGFIINNYWFHVLLRLVQPNSPGSKEKMSWYSTNRVQVAIWFPSDHPSRPDKSSCWKSTSLLLSTDILVCWIPCTSSSSSKFLGATSTWGTAFTATTWTTLMPLAIVSGMAFRFFTTTATHLLPEITLVYVFTTLKPRGKWGPSTLSGTALLHACCFPGTSFLFGLVWFWTKKYLSPPSLSFWPPPSNWSGPLFGLL